MVEGWQREEWDKSATNSSEAASTLWITYQAPLVNGLHSPHLSWCGRVRLACAPPSNRAFPWHKVNDLQSVWSAGASGRRENHLHKRGQKKKGCSGFPVCSHSSTGAQTQMPEGAQWTVQTGNTVRGVFSRLRCLLHKWMHTYTSNQPLPTWLSFKKRRQWAWLVLIHFSFWKWVDLISMAC